MRNEYSTAPVIPTGRNIPLWGLNILTICALGPLIYWAAIEPRLPESPVTEVTIQPTDGVTQTWRMVDRKRSIFQWGLNFKVHGDESDRTFHSLEEARAWWERNYGTAAYPQCYYNGEWVEPCPVDPEDN